MSDELEQNKVIRENRVALTQRALENGVSPLKAGEFGSRVADAMKESWNAPNHDPTMARNGSILSAVFRDSETEKLRAAVLFVDNSNRVKNAMGVAQGDAMGVALEEVSTAGVEKPSDIKNYAFNVSPVMTIKP